MISDNILWTPSDTQIKHSQISDFANYVKAKTGFDWNGNFQSLWQWSTDSMTDFWPLLWQWHGIIGNMGSRPLVNEKAMPGATFFPDATLNFAENLLASADDSLAISAHGEDGRSTRLTRAELQQKTMALAGWLSEKGVVKGDRIAAYTPNVAEAVITMLASATLGAVYSSCSPDFGLNGALDRFGQIEPKILMACDGYIYAGKSIDRMPQIGRAHV